MDCFEIVRARRNFTAISNRIFMDPALSLKAKGLLCVCLSLPPDWNFSIRGLTSLCKEGVGAVNSALVELEERGYLIREDQGHTGNGCFGGSRYIFFEDPEDRARLGGPVTTVGEAGDGQPCTDFPYTVDRDAAAADGEGGSPCTGFSDTVEQDAAAADREDGSPCTGFPYTVEPNTVQPYTDEPYTENPTQYNTKQSKTKQSISPPYSPPSLPDAGTEGRRKAGPKKAGTAGSTKGPDWKPDRFEAFWQYYPRGEKKEQARRAWDRLRPDDATVDAMARALRRQKESRMWRDGIGIPYASTWINQRRWEDEVRAGADARGVPQVPAPAVLEREEVDVW